MHTPVVSQFEIEARDAHHLARYYALLFGWCISANAGDSGKYTLMTSDREAIGGAITCTGDGSSGGVRMIVQVDDVLESVCYAEELGGRILELPHEVVSTGGQVTLASFTDPEGNRVGLSSRSQKLASAGELLA